MVKKQLSTKENLRKEQKNENLATFSNIDLEFIDTQVVNFFKKKNLQINDEVDGNLRSVEWIFATPERWRLMREGKDDKFNEVIKKPTTPIIVIDRTSIERDLSRNTGDVYNIVLEKKWAKRNQSLSKNIDSFLNKKYNNQYQVKYIRIPGFMKIGYTMTLLTSKQLHMNKLVEFFLEMDDIEGIKTERGELQLHFEEGFDDGANTDDFTDDQRKFIMSYNLFIVSQIIPEFTEDKKLKIQSMFTPITISTTENVL